MRAWGDTVNNGARSGQVGILLRRFRCDAGFTQEELAERAGLSIRALSDIERGRTGQPFARSIRLLADALAIGEQQRAELMGALNRQRAAAGPAQPAGSPNGGADGQLPPPVIPRQLPAPVSHFAGRAAELRLLNSLLDGRAENSATVISAVGGTAGVGKTALAIHWAHQAASRFPDGQLYINLRGFDPSGKPVMPAEAIRRFLDALAMPPDRIPPGPEAQEGLYRSILADRKMLIVLDNARDAAQVRPLLPGGPHNLVVVTSRSQLAGLAAAEGAGQIFLDLLSSAEARELLALRLGRGRLAAEPAAADKLVELCAGLPLALGIAAARGAAHPAFPLAALACELQDAGSKLDALDGDDAATSVRAVFSWSVNELTGPAARMFRLLSVHPGPDVSVAAAASLAGVPPAQARGLLAELALANLLTEHAPGRFAFHDLLRAYSAEQAARRDSHAERAGALRRTLDHYLHTACMADRLLYPRRWPLITLAAAGPGYTPSDGLDSHALALAWLDAEHHALIAATRAAADGGFDVQAWQLAWTLETFCHRRGHWRDWSASQQVALEAAQRLGDRFAERCARRGFASAELELGQYDTALSQLYQVVLLCQEDGDLATEARAQVDISRALGFQGRWAEALGHSREGLRVARARGQEWPAEGDLLNMAGWNLAMLGRFAEALDFCQQSVALHRRLGNKHGEPCSLDSLAYAQRGLGNHVEAAARYHQAIELYAELGYQYPKAESLTYAGDAHQASGDLDAARDAWTQALGILENLHHPEASEVRARLAGLDTGPPRPGRVPVRTGSREPGPAPSATASG